MRAFRPSLSGSSFPWEGGKKRRPPHTFHDVLGGCEKKAVERRRSAKKKGLKIGPGLKRPKEGACCDGSVEGRRIAEAHTKLRCGDHTSGSMRLEVAEEGVCDGMRRDLLESEAMGQTANEGGKLREADDRVTRDVGEVDAAKEGEEVMRAKAMKGDIAQEDHLRRRDIGRRRYRSIRRHRGDGGFGNRGRKSALQSGGRIEGVTIKEVVEPSFGDATRRVFEMRMVGGKAGRLEKRSDRLLHRRGIWLFALREKGGEERCHRSLSKLRRGRRGGRERGESVVDEKIHDEKIMFEISKRETFLLAKADGEEILSMGSAGDLGKPFDQEAETIGSVAGLSFALILLIKDEPKPPDLLGLAFGRDQGRMDGGATGEEEQEEKKEDAHPVPSNFEDALEDEAVKQFEDRKLRHP